MTAPIAKVIFMLYYCTSLISANNFLQCNYNGNRVCPEDVAVFICSVSDGVATVWRGSIFDCLGNQILLRHSNFEHSEAGVICNDGKIVAYSSEVTGNTHVSQLNVTISPEMHNGTVQCIQDGLNETLVGTCTLILATEPTAIEPPSEVHVSDINPNQVSIHWSPPPSNSTSCDNPILTYNIATHGCGVCPNTTSNPSIICTNLTVNGQACLVVIQAWADAENDSEHRGVTNLTIVLRVPSAPDIRATWRNQFASILTSFNITEQFYISDGIDGSATNYTITYSESTSGRTCDLVTISVSESACIHGQCNHVFDTSACFNFTIITITVFATNVLGDGPSSKQVLRKTSIHDQSAAGSLPRISIIVGGSSIVVILFFILIIIILACFLKKVYKSFQRPSNNQEQAQGIYSSPEPVGVINEGNLMDIIGVYTDIVQPVLYEDTMSYKATESCEVTGENNIIYENNYHEIDKTLNLDNLLIQIRQEVTPKWYQFGLAIGINKETLDEFSNFPPEECIVEMSDLWLRTSETTVIWRDVANVLKEIGCHRLAEKILKTYKTGTLLADQEAADAVMSLEQSSITANDQDNTSESSQPDRPPLPPKTYQTS